ncbi:hypothetical protein FJZ36_10640 [Candidatus Poribacteria bacterium]|nr:hypothetical protein [Candidatus Poribacteria bacterium]
MLAKVLSRTLWHVYDALGSLLIANLLWFALSLPWWSLVVLLSLPFDELASALIGVAAVPVAFLNPASSALGEMAQRLAETGSTDLRTFWRGLRHHLFRSVLLMSVGVLMTMMLAASAAFYGGGVFSALGTYGNLLAAGFTVWAMVFVGAMSSYWVPVAVGIDGKSPRVWFTLKRSAFLTLDSPLFALCLLAATIISAAFWTVTVLGVFTIGMSFIRVLHAEARHVLREKHETANRLTARSASPPTRSQVMDALRESWRSQPKRGLRELLKPWEPSD